MSVRFCEPEVVNNNRKNTVQLLVHGVTETKLYWSGLSYPTGINGDTYSWIAYASRQGYPTLAIDRIGNGNSTHPDPVLVTQMNLEEAVLHQLVLKLKSGAGHSIFCTARAKTSQLGQAVPGRTFSRVVFVGHSYGSILGNMMATTHPTDIAAYILTGYGVSVIPVAAGLPQTVPFPAALYSATRFAGFALGYLATSSQIGRRNYLWGADGSYDQAVFLRDFTGEDVVGVGEILSITAGLKAAPAYAGPVAVITGERDEVFCLGGFCGTGPQSPQAQSCSFFPKSPNCTYNIPLGTGHMIDLHYSAQQSFKYAHDFLAQNGF
ncbi:hypothetical protein MMC16_001881 [Acarospora aff. strigata]|nr:hypothetical protein [Acarospora aff. strigata]